MDSKDFIFWLNGYLELANPKELNEQQIQIIKDHINLVLHKVTPGVGQHGGVVAYTGGLPQGTTGSTDSYCSTLFALGDDSLVKGFVC